MNILFIHSYYNTDKSIVSSRSHEMCVALVKRGHRVTALAQVTSLNEKTFAQSTGFIRRVIVDGVDIRGVKIPYRNSMGMFIRILSFFSFMVISTVYALCVRKLDIVFATSTPPTVAIPALLVKWFKRIPFVFELRDLWPDFVEQIDVLKWFPKWGFRSVESAMRFIYRRADFVTTTTPGMTELMKKKNVNEHRLGTLLLGSDIDVMSRHMPLHPILSCQELSNKFILCYVGSVSYGYGLEQMLDIAVRFKDRDDDIAFLIVGHGSKYQIIKNMISELQLKNTVICPAIEYHLMPSILKYVHVGYESSIPTGASDTAFCNKFYDYMAAGLPILSNYDGDMGGFLKRHGCGAVIRDPNEAANWILALKSDRTRYKHMSEKCSMLAKGVLSRTKEIAKFVSLIEACVAGEKEIKCMAPLEMLYLND